MATCWNLILPWLAVVFLSSRGIEVETPLGKIAGTRIKFLDREVDRYVGIPYAMPPLGNLRFQKTIPVKSYNGTIEAHEMGPACEQYSTEDFPWYYNGTRDENCLFLNIWVPVPLDQAPRNKTIMYWVHGGGFVMGSIRQPLYDGTALASFGDVIVVTVNYRLGAFGFLYTGSEDAPGNMALYDQLEGLKWVNANIRYFGGNPNSITIFGESAGSLSVALFTLSPLTKNLYKRAILESSSSIMTVLDTANTANLKYAQELAKNLSCADDVHTIHVDPKGVVDCMRNVDAREIAIASSKLPERGGLSFLPQYGDPIVPKNPRLSTILDNFRDSEILIGYNRDEGSYFLSASSPEIFGLHGEKNTAINKTMGKDLLQQFLDNTGLNNTGALIETVLNSDSNKNLDIRHQVYALMGDAITLCPTVFFAEEFAKRGNNVFFYLFDHRPSTTPWAPWMGVAHYEEVQFVFGNPFLYPDDYTQCERSLSKEMIEMWTTFAKTGNPGNSWPTFSKKNPIFRLLNTPSTSKAKFDSNLRAFNCDLLRPIYTSVEGKQDILK